MERERERRQGDDDKHSLEDVPRVVCVTHKSLDHKKHTGAAKPSLESSAKALSLVDSGPPTQTFSHAQKHANKKTPFHTLLDHSHHCLHSLILMTCFVFCLQISLAIQEERKKREEN